MKRFLIIAFVVMLVVAMLAVPAFADSVYVYDTPSEVDGFLLADTVPPAGQYEVTILAYFEGDLILDLSGVAELGVMQDDDMTYFGGLFFPYNADGASGVMIYFLESMPIGPDRPDYTPTVVGINIDGLNLTSYVLTFRPVPVSGEEAAVDSVFGVFTGIGSWLVAELGNATSLFYQADTGLTILGVLAVAGLGIAVVFLLINWIKSLLQFRK